MDYQRDTYSDIVHVVPGPCPENWSANCSDSNSIWATEDDYRAWNNHDGGADDSPLSSNYQLSRSGTEPPNKKSRNISQESAFRKSMGKIFYKTKLCCKFRQGTCPYVTNCNFAHTMEELRRPPANWQDIVASQVEEREDGNIAEIREEFQIPSIGAYGGETQRSYKGRHCKKFYTDEGCPYGDNCTFLHDEQSKNRESVAISLGPGGYGGVPGGAGGGLGGGFNGGNGKPSNWKTRICNKWELTGYCPFGTKCHFAHGTAELNRMGGGSAEVEAQDYHLTSNPRPFGVAAKAAPGPEIAVSSFSSSAAHLDAYHHGVPSLGSSSFPLQKAGQRAAHQKWKGPDKISRIYGDWIDD